jgi:hypothetical protein
VKITPLLTKRKNYDRDGRVKVVGLRGTNSNYNCPETDNIDAAGTLLVFFNGKFSSPTGARLETSFTSELPA